MTMFPNPMPEMPAEFMEAVMANPDAAGEAFAAATEAFGDAMANGGDPGAAFEAMGDVMGPMMGDMGVSPEVFEAAGEAFGAAVGPAILMGPADQGSGDVAAIMQDAVQMMTPEGMDVPAPIMDAMGDMGSGCADAAAEADVPPHDMGAGMMDAPGEPNYPLPVDGEGNAVVEPGDPASCPAEACQPPPADGAVAAMAPEMMPPEGGYDHAPVTDDMVMPEPFVMAQPDPTGALSGSENIAPASGPENIAPAEPVLASADDAAAALGGGLGGGDPVAPMGDDAAADAALMTAMDSASGGEGAPVAADPAAAAPVDGDVAGMEQAPEPEEDSSAGMG
jgi:hypothetical protein